MHGDPLPDTSAWTILGRADRNSYRVSDEVVDMRRPTRTARVARLAALPQDVLFEVDRSALIVIDMVNDFCAAEGWIGSIGVDLAPTHALIDPINAVSASFRVRGAPVIWVSWGVRPDRLNLSPGTQHPFNPNGRAPGLAGERSIDTGPYKVLAKDSWGARIFDKLTQGPDDVYVDKHRISGFWDTPLNAILANLGVTTLFFAGVNADHCVLGTLMDANFHGYDTILVEDCVATTSPDFCMQATLHNVRFCFGFTATSADTVASVTAAATT